MSNERAIRRSLVYRGWPGVLPGTIALALLIFLPGFMSVFNAVTGLGEIPTTPTPSVDHGVLAVPQSIAAGFIGGAIAAAIGIALGWALAGSRLRLFVFIPLCLPAVLGESASGSAFAATIGSLMEHAFPLSSLLTFTLFEMWRLIGPIAVVATFIVEHTGKITATERLPFAHKLSAGWRRWKGFAGASLFAAILVALTGAGHIAIADAAGRVVPIIGPAEPAWRNPTLQAATAWAALTWPLFIIANALFLTFALRLPGSGKFDNSR